MSLRAQISEEVDPDYDTVATRIREEGYARYVAGYDRIVFTNGCFDILHGGHVSTLRHAFELAGPSGIVVVGMNDDESVRRLKGPSRPICDQSSRAILLVSLKYVDYVVTFSEDTPEKLIRSLRPDFIVKGEDYKDKHVVGSDIAEVSFAPYDGTLSTSKLIDRIRSNG